MSDLRLHNDGQEFICMDCGEVVHRTRDNPYPEHRCPKASPYELTDDDGFPALNRADSANKHE